MTKEKFERWLVDHYVELVREARKRRPYDQPEDIVNTAIVQMLANGGYENIEPPATPWTWTTKFYIKGAVRDQKRAAARRARAYGEARTVLYAYDKGHRRNSSNKKYDDHDPHDDL